MKKFLGVSLLAGTLLFNTATAAPTPQDKETIYQVALLQSLAMGYLDGSITVKDLKTHGDTGIGTFEGVNGEMIV
ncbi:MAG: acetolactate decarboxylase, partial [Selenomonadaceae bacterium]|nr:acetolactate decarboxylase [Selenomonadaceae bacterium]